MKLAYYVLKMLPSMAYNFEYEWMLKIKENEIIHRFLCHTFVNKKISISELFDFHGYGSYAGNLRKNEISYQQTVFVSSYLTTS